MIKESKSHEKIALPPSTLLNPVPVVMVSCAGKNPELPLERPNILTVAWAGTVCSEPPMVFISIRSNRHSYPLIRETGEFVINLVTEDLFKACDYCGVRTGAKEDKFAAMSLTSVPAEGLQYAPAILEAPLSMACQVVSETELGSHVMFVAKIVSVSADMNLFDKEGKLCLDDAKLIAYSHGEYYSLGQILGFFGHSVASPEAYERRMKGKNQPEKIAAAETTIDITENEDDEATEKEDDMKSENQKPDYKKSEFKKSNYSQSRERKPGFSKSDEGSGYAPKKQSYAPKKPSFPKSDSRDSRPPRDGDSRDSRPPRDFGDRDSRPSSYSSSGPRTSGYSSGPRKPSFPRSDSRDSRPPRDGDSRDSRPPRDGDSRDSRPPRDFGDRDSRPSRDSGNSRSSRPSSYSSSGPRTSSYSSGPRKPSFPRSDSRDSRPPRDGDSRDSRPSRDGDSRESRPPRDFGDRDSRPSRDSRPLRDSGDARSSRPSTYSSSGPRKPGFTKPGFRKPGPGGSSDNNGRNRFGPSSH